VDPRATFEKEKTMNSLSNERPAANNSNNNENGNNSGNNNGNNNGNNGNNGNGNNNGNNNGAYEAPSLVLVGNTIDVVLGPPGGGWDGPYGITEPQFEFQADDMQ